MNPLDELPAITQGYPHPGQWSDDDEMPPPKRMRSCDQGYASDHTAVTDYGEQDQRTWAQQHLEAADIRQPAMLTPPSMVKIVFLLKSYFNRWKFL